MAYLDEATGAEDYNWDEEGIYQLEVSDPVQAGPGGISNLQAKLLAVRTRNLHLRLASREQWDLDTLRGGIAEELDTLEALRAHIVQLIADAQFQEVDVQAILDEIRGGVAAEYDTLLELKNYIDTLFQNLEISFNDLTNLPVFQGSADLADNVINWNGVPELRKTLSANTEFDASNLIAGKTIGLEISGAFTATFSSKFVKVDGSPDPDPAEVNYVTMRCIRADAGNERIIYSVNFLNV